MNALALYRKYRPEKFKDVLGQEHIVKVLQGAIKDKNVGHAYLFTGTRGTGKTSIARILAKEIGTTEKDLYEMDAASNRGIDDVRQLREAVNTLPFDSPYKVYIIDEVHMLTKEAFNALLKTLEEPPAHVIFILATTELEKLPDTIISRCEVHQFKSPTRQILKKHVTSIAKQEGYELEGAAAELIALLAEGSFRDAQGVLQKVLHAVSGKEISVEDVSLVTGAPKGELVNAVLDALETQDAEKGLQSIAEAASSNVDMHVFAKLLLEKMRAVLLLRFAKDMKASLADDFSEEDMMLLEKYAGNNPSHITSQTLALFLDAYTQVNYAYVAHLPLELAIIDSVQKEL